MKLLAVGCVIFSTNLGVPVFRRKLARSIRTIVVQRWLKQTPLSCCLLQSWSWWKSFMFFLGWKWRDLRDLGTIQWLTVVAVVACPSRGLWLLLLRPGVKVKVWYTHSLIHLLTRGEWLVYPPWAHHCLWLISHQQHWEHSLTQPHIHISEKTWFQNNLAEQQKGIRF